MDRNRIISDLKAERNRIDQAIAALEAIGSGLAESPRRAGRPVARATSTASASKQSRGPRHMSPAARKRISEAAKKRWAERRKATKTA
jgi:hypothetical protein